MTVRHPAKFSPAVLRAIQQRISRDWTVLDPFAGVGSIHKLDALTYGVEIEPEWAEAHPDTEVGDATDLMFARNRFDAIVTSPCYGNRMADHHEAKDDSRRMTYAHVLGRPLHEHNAGSMQWGPAYRELHEQAWREAVRVLRPGGVFMLNISNHIRKGKVQRVMEWHIDQLVRCCRLELLEIEPIGTRRMGFGANRDVRLPTEHLVTLRKFKRRRKVAP